MRARRSSAGGLIFLKPHEVLQLENPRVDASNVLLLPCGRCIGCKKERAATWALRIMHEASMHQETAFLTLTYSDEHLPHGNVPTLDKRDLQLFHDRVRKATGPFRYFACGEYGGQTARPHYHCITFGWRPKYSTQATGTTYQSDELDRLWRKGNCTVGHLTPASAAYVAQYAQKKLYGQKERELGRAHEFLLMSKGLGKAWLYENCSDLDRGYLQDGNRRVRMPRYYKNKKGESDEDWLALQEKRAQQFRDELDPKKTWDDYLRVRETVAESKQKFFQSHREPDQFKNA